MFCRTRELMVTVPSSVPLSAYIGTSIMSMNGDFPGLSNFWPGTIGSCQYSTFLPVAGSTSPAFCGAARGIAAAGARTAADGSIVWLRPSQ